MPFVPGDLVRPSVGTGAYSLGFYDPSRERGRRTEFWLLGVDDIVLVIGITTLGARTGVWPMGPEACVLDGHGRVGWVFTDALERV